MNTCDERSWVEFSAEDFVGAIGKDGDAPVADEGDELAVVRGLDLGAEALGFVDDRFAFDIDEHEIPGLSVKALQTLLIEQVDSTE